MVHVECCSLPLRQSLSCKCLASWSSSKNQRHDGLSVMVFVRNGVCFSVNPESSLLFVDISVSVSVLLTELSFIQGSVLRPPPSNSTRWPYAGLLKHYSVLPFPSRALTHPLNLFLFSSLPSLFYM